MAERDELLGLAARLRAGAVAIAALRPAVEAAMPWPLSDRFGVEPEATWGPPETLAHVAEMLPYWTAELERVLEGTGPPVPFGRVASDERRIAAIARDRTLPPGELLARIEAGAERLAARLEALPPAADRPGVHPTLGEMTAAELVRRFAASHLEEHAEQLRRLLGESA